MRLLALAAALSLAAPAFAQTATMTGKPKWSSGCDAKSRDQFGDRKRAYCWLFVSNMHNSGTLMDDNAYAISQETLFEIDARGLRLAKPQAKNTCRGKPQRIAVDGRRIDQLPANQQINAILNGSRLVWETQALWPYCGIAPHGTYLDGVQEAVAELREKWADASR